MRCYVITVPFTNSILSVLYQYKVMKTNLVDALFVEIDLTISDYIYVNSMK